MSIHANINARDKLMSRNPALKTANKLIPNNNNLTGIKNYHQQRMERNNFDVKQLISSKPDTSI